ncbi:phage holin family protein [Paenibacillus sp. Marseille-Q4541]|uniref:phage holin family protein n=1 Tax=Paenibacillus sp. Marseille-Q4541 TaxID=2831522 RepID=UPI001BA6FEBC|nr:phage holin family protein [Paenibacillus sp. Marseille-Q4541]
MEWNAISELIDPRLIIVLALCWVVGFVLKQTPKVPDWTIVYIVTAISVLLTVWMIDWSPESLIQGVLTAAVAVYGNQIIKQGKKGVEKDGYNQI